MGECPECGASNPGSAVECTACGARLEGNQGTAGDVGPDSRQAPERESSELRRKDVSGEPGAGQAGDEDWLAQLLSTIPEEPAPPGVGDWPGGAVEQSKLPGWLRNLDSERGPDQPPATSEGVDEAGEAASSDGGAPPADRDAAESAALELGTVLAAEAFVVDALDIPGALQPGRFIAADAADAPAVGEDPGMEIEVPWGGLTLGEGGERLPGSVASQTDAHVLAERVRSLERFVAAPLPTRVVAEERRGAGRLDLLGRVIVAAVLVAVVILASAPPPALDRLLPVVSLPDGYPAGPAGMHDALRAVGAGERVLLAFEYGPAQADEMGLVAGPLIRQLAAKGAQLSVVSTRPDGLVSARDALREAASYGAMASAEAERIASAGAYRPGDAVGVARLLQLGEKPDAIVVFASKIGPLRRWIEQVRAIGMPVPLVAATSASIEGVAASYWSGDSRPLAGYVSGVSGAAYYERIVDGSPDGPAARRLGVLGAGNVAIVLLVVVGALADVLSGAWGKLGKGR